MSYDAALQSVAGGGIPLDSRGMVILSSYCEFTGKLPESTAPATQDHLSMLQGIATEAKLLLGRNKQSLEPELP